MVLTGEILSIEKYGNEMVLEVYLNLHIISHWQLNRLARWLEDYFDDVVVRMGVDWTAESPFLAIHCVKWAE